MMIEEESIPQFQYQATPLEHQLLEAIQDSLNNHLTANASFLAERLVCEHDIEEFRSFLAECYLKENKAHKVCHLLKDCKTEYARFQLAVAYFRCGKHKESEKVLIGAVSNPQMKLQGVIPNGAYGHYLLAQVYEKQARTAEAKDHYYQALEINPTLWIAYERLTKLGEMNQGNKIFSDLKHRKYETSRKKNNQNILHTITNILSNRQNLNKTITSASKEDDEENKKDDLSENKLKNTPGRLSGTQSQLTNPQAISQFIMNLDEASNQKPQITKTRSTRQPSQTTGFLNFTQIPQPLQRSSVQKKSQVTDIQRVGSLAIQQNQPFSTNSQPQNITSLPSLLRTLAVPYQLWTQQHSEAINAFMKLPPNHYKSGWALEKVARSLMDQVKYSEAEKIWKELKEIEPNRLEGMDYYSSCLWNLRKQTELTYLAHSCLQISNLAPETWIVLGNCFSLNKENENSLKYFSRAIQLKPDHGYAHTLCGHEYVQIEDFQKAQRCYEQALTMDAQQYNAWWGLGNIAYKKEKYEQAITYFKRAIAVNSRNSVIHCFLGMAYAAADNHVEALKQYQLSETIDPKNGMNRYEKANSLVKQQQYETALNELRQLELMLPKEPQIYLLMGKIYKKLGKVNESYKCFQGALSLENKDQQRIKGMIDSLNNDLEFNDDFDL